MEKKILEQQALNKSLKSKAQEKKELASKLEISEKELEEARSIAQTDRATAFEACKEQGLAEGRDQGIAEGRALFLQSQEFQDMLGHARLNGARDFLRSRTFREAVENQASDFMIEGFEKCQGQIQKPEGFVENFDLEQLDVSLDKKLEPYPPGPAPADDFPKFLPLMDDLPPPFPIS
ncbi:UNVERIFIED_CONTAM: hypothetical protein Sindi_2881600 [Sesamum indicum]